MKDWRGTPITEGSKIIYPGRVGSHMYVTEADVLEITTKANPYGLGDPVPALRVRRTRDTGFGTPKAIENAKPSLIDAISRVTVVG